jgi:hypothetical protein
MRVFKINKNILVVCRSESTRYGFRHLATLIYNNYERETVKICYYNRTWERFTFESVLQKLNNNNKTLSEKENKIFKNKIKKFSDRLY